MGQGEKAKTVLVAQRDVVTPIRVCESSTCHWHTGRPSGNLEWIKHCGRVSKDAKQDVWSYDRHVSKLKQAAWRLESEPAQIQSGYDYHVELMNKITLDQAAVKAATSGRLVRHCLRWFVEHRCNLLLKPDDYDMSSKITGLITVLRRLSEDVPNVFIDPQGVKGVMSYKAKAIKELMRGLILAEYDNAESITIWDRAVKADPNLEDFVAYLNMSSIVLSASGFTNVGHLMGQGIAEFRNRMRMETMSWVNYCMDNPRISEKLLDDPGISIGAAMERQDINESDAASKMTLAKVLRELNDCRRAPTIQSGKEANAPLIPGVVMLESEIAVKTLQEHLDSWSLAMSNLLDRFHEGKKVVLGELPKEVQRFFCVEALGWSEHEFTLYAETSFLYAEAPEPQGALKDLAAIASLVERYTNSGIYALRGIIDVHYDKTY
jgi:hypothetical protein